MTTSFSRYPIMVKRITKEELKNIKSILEEEKIAEAREINESIVKVTKSAYNYSTISPRFKRDPRIVLIALEGYEKIVKAAANMLEVLSPSDKNYAWTISQREAALKEIEELKKILCPEKTVAEITRRV